MKVRFIIVTLIVLAYKTRCGYTLETIDIKWITESLHNVIRDITNILPSKFTKAIIQPRELEGIARFLLELYQTNLKNTEIPKNITELIKYNGFNAEEHQVETEDGYILTMHRIPGNGSTIFLMHGILLSSDDWVTAGRDIGLAYLLADRGFDIWMGNARGNKHSRRHRTLSPNTAQFWDFSYYEMGIYDVPSMLDYILKKKQESQLIYVGHSQGCANIFVTCSEKGEYNSKISLLVALAPATAIPNIKPPVLLLIKFLSHYRPQYVFGALRNLGYYEFLYSEGLLRFFTIAVCGNRVFQPICNKILFLVSGFDYSQANYPTLATVYAHILAGTSTKDLEHYAQSVSSRKFSKFDYGKKINKQKYGSKLPPEFSVGNITIPIAILYGANDKLTPVKDILNLRQNLNSVIRFIEVPYKNFDHLDFLYAKDFKNLVLPELLKLINEHEHISKTKK